MTSDMLKERVRNAQLSLDGADPDYYLISVFEDCLKRIEELEYENAKLRR